MTVPSAPSGPQIVVVYRSPLFLQSVEVALAEAPDIRIVRTARDPRDAVESARRLRAAVVVLEEPEPDHPRELLDSLFQLSDIRRIITFGLGSTTARVYASQAVQLESSATLIAAIRGAL